jgi:L,D-transpeptidase YcbB
MPTHISRASAAGAALIIAAACGSDSRVAQAGAVDRGGTVAARPAPPARQLLPNDVRAAINARLNAVRPAAVTVAQWQCVRALYDRTDGLPVWLDTTGTDERARSLVRELAAASTHGLAVDPVQVDSLRVVLGRVWGSTTTASPDDVATADVLLSIAFVGLAEDLVMGQLDPRAVTRGWYITPSRPDIDSTIVRSIATAPVDSLVTGLEPDDPVYAALRTQLAVYRRIVAGGGWGSVPAGPALRSGARGDPARLSALVRRLSREGYLTDSVTAGDSVYDARLAEAVTRFQAHHAITVDGALNPETVRALNVPADYRVAQIAANLERIRWLPRASTAGRHLIINVPSFRLLLRNGTRTESAMRVVVGAEYQNRATPAFADSMNVVVFQPYWNVTPNITVNEVIPKAARDPGYLARNDYEVVRGYGDDAPVVSAALLTRDAVRAGRVRVRQRPGPKNALGHVKFLFPNDFNIYLHDTPQRELFARDVRAFSHGCIRVERPAELAQWILGWDSTRVADAMTADRANRYVPLARKLPVYIVYLTAFTRDGELFFGNDLYARDDALVRSVASAALPSARESAALDSLGRLAMR